MAGGYSVEQEAMARGSQAVEEATVLIGGQVKRLDSEVQAMFGGWGGQAQVAFANLHGNWVAQQQKLLAALRDMQAALVSTSRTYAAQEEEQSGAFGHIAGQL